MKIVKAFFVMLHIQLILPVATFFLASQLGEKISTAISIIALLSFVLVQILGWICAVYAVKMLFRSKTAELEKAWVLLKIKTIPFYIVNFIVCLFAGMIFTFGTAGMLAILDLVMIFHTCAFIIQSGFFGAANIAILRKKYRNNISVINYLLQFISVLDVIDTIALRHKVKKLQANFTEEKIP